MAGPPTISRFAKGSDNPRAPAARIAQRLPLGLLAACLAIPLAAAAQEMPSPAPAAANFQGEAVSNDARLVADWISASGDNQSLPFVLIDKVNTKVFVFDGRGQLRGAAPALLGMGQGDDSVPGIGKRKLATISPKERTTPSGRFVAALGRDFEQDILWVDYETSLSLHRVITGNAKERRFERLASPTTADNRISYGCINVPVKFYDDIVMPAFTGTIGIVYILPETRRVHEVFAIPDVRMARLAQRRGKPGSSR